MIAIVTDAHYRMAASLIRDLAQNGAVVIVCESAKYKKPLGFASKYVFKRFSLPENGGVDALLSLCAKITADYAEKPVLLPVGAATLAAVSARRAEFEPVCGLCIPTTEQLDLLNDKTALHELCLRFGVPVPEQYAPALGTSVHEFAEKLTYPCVVKPLCGEKFGLTAAARYRIVHSAAELEQSYAAFCALTGETPVVQQYLTGEGFGCSVVCLDGRVVSSIAHRRVREYPVSGGPSSCCEVIDDEPFLRAVCTLVKELDFSGVAMFEFKSDGEGTPRLLECNPRVWGSFPLTRVSGSNFAWLWCCLSAGAELPPVVRPKKVKMAYYPSDLAAAFGYLRRKKFAKAFGAAADLFSPSVKNGLYEPKDPLPSAWYRRGLLHRSK